MKIDNQRNSYRIWLSRLVMTIVFALVILVLMIVSWFDNLESGITKYHMVILISAIYLIVNLVNFLKSPYFVSYNDYGERIVVRYYPLSMFTSRKHSIEIPKKQFVKFELKPFLLGTQHKLILIQNFRGKEARYAPISLSALDKEDRQKMLQSLESHAAKG
jgi:hypothetical protein